MNHSSAPWVIVLAAGAGSRLSDLTTGADGAAVPKQFCSLRGGRSLLVDTIARARRLTARDRVLVVVAAEHERWWREQVRCVPAANVIVQPQNRGTGPGLLLPLLHVLARDPKATFVSLPSDHHVDRPGVLLAAIWRALQAMTVEGDAAGDGARDLVLFGITPDVPDSEYGWIVPGRRSGFGSDVTAFVEKPDSQRAAALLAAGGVWNSFVLAGRVRSAFELASSRLPAAAAAIAGVQLLPAAAQPAALTAVYDRLEPQDFSRQVLATAASRLRLVMVPECGWTDLGTPRRVADCVAALERRSLGAPARPMWFPTVDLARALGRRGAAMMLSGA